MRPSLRSRACLAAALLALAACGTEVPFTPEPPPFCDSSVTMQVAGGTTPTIAWSPGCRVTRITVLQGADTMWYIRHADGIEPGVRYGDAPYGAQIYRDARTLVAGQSYDFRAWLIRADTVRVYGTATYVP